MALRHAGMQLEWHRCSTSAAGPVVKPVVVLLAWVWAKQEHIKKYTDMLNRHGWDVLVCTPPTLAMWLPPWATHNARMVLRELSRELFTHGERPVVFYIFSGAAKGCYYKLLELLVGKDGQLERAAAYSAVRRCCVGQMFDSGPVDFTSEAGQKLMATALPSQGVSGAAARWSTSLVAGAMDFTLLELFEASRADMWSAIQNGPCHGPTLFLYSRSDDLAEAPKIAALAAALKSRGRAVVEQVWEDSPHVGHMRQHGEQYEECVGFLLESALVQWSVQNDKSMQDPWQQDVVLDIGRFWGGSGNGHGGGSSSGNSSSTNTSSGSGGDSSRGASAVRGQGRAASDQISSRAGGLVMQPVRGRDAPSSQHRHRSRVPGQGAQQRQQGTAGGTGQDSACSCNSSSSCTGACSTSCPTPPPAATQLSFSACSARISSSHALSVARASAELGCCGRSGADCSCSADCECAQLLAAACGEVPCSSTAALSHTIRCLHRGILERQLTRSQEPGAVQGIAAVASADKATAAAAQERDEEAPGSAQQQGRWWQLGWRNAARPRSKL